MNAKSVWQITKDAYSEWSEDKASRLAAALAFYTMLSLAPLLIVVLKIVGAVWGTKAAKGQLFDYINQTVGSRGAEAIQGMIANDLPNGGGLATIISLLILIYSGSNVFAELQDSLNTIWEVQPKPDRPWWATVKDRAFSFGLVLVVAFLLLVSLVLSSMLSILSAHFLPSTGWIAEILHLVISLVVITGLFGLMFKYLPDVHIRWRYVWIGAAITAVLFTIGKFLLGLYLGRASTVSVYGAFGSLVALLLWTYYSAQIFFFGAEFTQVYVERHGGRGQVAENAVPITEEARAHQGLPRKQALPAMARETEYYNKHGGRPAPGFERRIVIDRPHSKAATPLAAGAGLAAGVAVGVWAAWNRLSRRSLQHDLRRTHLDQRLSNLETRIGRIRAFKRYSQDYGIRERIDDARGEVRHVADELHRLKRNPELAPTTQDYVRYVFGLKPRKAPFGQRLARALYLGQ